MGAPNVINDRLSEDQKDEIAEEIVQSRQNSFSNRGVVFEPVGSIDTTNVDEVRQFLMFMGETIRSKNFENKGRVELMLHDSSLPKGADNAVVIEAKHEVLDDDDEGLFQTGAYIVIENVKYGVYTSHRAWKFLRMDPVPSSNSESHSPAYVIRHTPYFDLMKTSYRELDQQSIDVYAHLLEVFRVPKTTDLMASAVAANFALDTSGQKLTSLIAK